MPPEVWKGSRDFRPRGDLFAVGCMLYELVTLRRLFDGPIVQVFEQVLKRDAATEAAQVREVAPGLAPIVRKLLEREPEQRYQAARDVALDLEALRARSGAQPETSTFLRLFAAIGSGRRVDEPVIDRLFGSGDPRWIALASRASGRTPPAPATPVRAPRGARRLTAVVLVATAVVTLALVVVVVGRAVGGW